MAFPTETDLRFHESLHRPAWASLLIDARNKRKWPPAAELPTLIESVVNAHAGIRLSSGECAAHNLLAIVRSYRRRGLDLESELKKIAVRPECAIRPERRASFARKWARRMQTVRA